MLVDKEHLESIMPDELADAIDLICILAHGFDGDADDFREYCLDRIRESDIIYYHKAITYLAENDPSLRDSLEIASEYGYDAANLNSEILATILYQHSLKIMLYELDLESCFTDEESI